MNLSSLPHRPVGIEMMKRCACATMLVVECRARKQRGRSSNGGMTVVLKINIHRTKDEYRY